MNLCLFCLSLVDGLFIISYSLSGSHCVVRVFRPDLQMWWKWLMHSYLAGLYRGFHLCSGCLTMIISVERCVCVFLPLRATSLIRTRTMVVIVFTTIAMIQGICLVYPLRVQPLFGFLCCFYFFLICSVYGLIPYIILIFDSNT